MGAMLDDTVGPPAPPETVHVRIYWKDTPGDRVRESRVQDVAVSYTTLGDVTVMILTNVYSRTDEIIPLSSMHMWVVENRR